MLQANPPLPMNPVPSAGAEQRLPHSSAHQTHPPTGKPKVGYVLKVYPRFSETFIVTEILAREAAGETIEIFSLRPPVDPRFHPELARVQAPVHYLSKPYKLTDAWQILTAAEQVLPGITARFAEHVPSLAAADPCDVWQAIELAMMIKARGVDHLHAHFASLSTRVAELASRLSGIPFSFTAHAKDIFHDTVDQAHLQYVLGRAQHAVTISEFNYLHLRTRFPDQTEHLHLVYNGLELDRFPFSPPAPVGRTLRIAAVGRLVEKKGFALLLEASAALTRAGHRLEVRIAGGGELADQLAARIGELGLGPAVTLLGARPQHEITALLRWADVFVAPCIVGDDGNADGLPTVLLEAMAMGVPTIASDVTGIPEIIENGVTGLLVRSGEVAELERALTAAAARKFDRGGIARAARAQIERNFDSERQALRLRQLLNREPVMI